MPAPDADGDESHFHPRTEALYRNRVPGTFFYSVQDVPHVGKGVFVPLTGQRVFGTLEYQTFLLHDLDVLKHLYIE